ncbi:MAG: DUF47 family protein [Myxococcales bacterium]|nr:DUF47 family protein [Polyangiaceae bacterium]MDW8248128.1 DUF47 family protein [Myxococcales bacterium]
MGLQDAVRWLLPKEDLFFEVMEKQTANIAKAATEMQKFRPGQGSASENAKKILEIEHEGDALLHRVEDALARTFVTPIDREDIQRLASMLDDTLDLLNETARSMDLYGLEVPSPPMLRLTDLIADAAKILADAMPQLRKANYPALVEANREIKKLEKEGDRIFRDAVGSLFRDDGISPKQLLRDKELLRDLEDALDSCEDVSEFLAHLAVKNG